MKLVDVDNVNIPVMQRRGDGWVFKFNFKEVLDTLPTVDAISVEWIKDRIREINNEMTNLYVHYTYCDDEEKSPSRRNGLGLCGVVGLVNSVVQNWSSRQSLGRECLYRHSRHRCRREDRTGFLRRQGHPKHNNPTDAEKQWKSKNRRRIDRR